jgi:hypothetical protein
VKWDYLIWWGDALPFRVLAQHGDHGWELVQVIKDPPGSEWKLQAVFKRPKAEEVQP